MPEPAYLLKLPDSKQSCVIFSSPHSGSNYPTDLLVATNLDHVAIRSSEDAYVDELFASATEVGATLLCATAPRAYVDLNRGAEELDPAVVEGIKPRDINPCVAAGLGVIPRVVAEGKVIRAGKISLDTAQHRLAQFYHPYHRKLGELLSGMRDEFGMTVLIDCHSMPHAALRTAPLVRRQVPDIVLGDRFGASCDRWISETVERAFTTAGFTVARNTPFAGGYITRHYGRPKRGIHAIQIEIDRALYMDERLVLKKANFSDFQQVMHDVTRRLAQIGPSVDVLVAE